MATVLDTSAKLDDLPSDALVQVRIIAANAAGEGAASEVVEEQVPALAQAA